MTINNFIKKRPYLIWHTKNFGNLSEESIVEAVLNYGNWDDLQKMIKILGLKKKPAFLKRNPTKRDAIIFLKLKIIFSCISTRIYDAYRNSYKKAIN